jgi:hypothetical protein
VTAEKFFLSIHVIELRVCHPGHPPFLLSTFLAAAGVAGASEDANWFDGTCGAGAGEATADAATWVGAGAGFAVRQAIPLMSTSSEFTKFPVEARSRHCIWTIAVCCADAVAE